MSDATRSKTTVFVGGLDGQVSEQTLHDAFLPFGEIVSVSLPKPELYGPSNENILNRLIIDDQIQTFV
jgi:RNA recognition motif-containing protein